MARKEYFPNIRRTDRKEKQVAQIARNIGVEEDDFAAVFDFALALAVLISDKLDAKSVKKLTSA